MKNAFAKITGLLAGLAALGGAVMAQPADTPVNPFAHDPAAVAAGEKVFNSTCTACHGEGATGGRGPALNTGRFAHGDGDYDLYQTIRAGVPGTQMPSFARLPSDDVWKAVTYIKSLSSQGSRPGCQRRCRGGRTDFFRQRQLHRVP